ncbi:hypothetical protein OHA72_04535 [Dactylosporangium sp. NBC_01737]|uniref:hypothetical protein n=1 Tax=Dactylosporangium sp. NBC_01737 TaxID=2975959 RepID=UPI002E13FDE0|nr:hypothetical protein OHA72_04535 [Dactylosporangium sp. NBC_01737]
MDPPRAAGEPEERRAGGSQTRRRSPSRPTTAAKTTSPAAIPVRSSGLSLVPKVRTAHSFTGVGVASMMTPPTPTPPT